MKPNAAGILTAFLLLGFLAPVPAVADTVAILETDEQAAQVRVDLARQASEQVLAAYFIFRDDETGLAGLYLLRDAARRGLDVRLIVDAQWNKVARPLMAHLVDEGVGIRLYHKFHLLKPFWWTRRMHDKLMITDGRYLVTGGRNIENYYFGLGDRKYVDRDAFVEGDAAEAAREYFFTLWNSRHVGLPDTAGVTPGQRAEAASTVDAAAEILRDSPLLVPAPEARWRAAVREVGEVRFLHDEVARKRKRPGIRADLVEILDGARQRVVIETPYLVVTRGLMRSLERLTGRGIHVRILTNSLQATDNILPQAGYVGHKKELTRIGVELWEYTGPRTLHSKSAVIDGCTVIVGSYNLDPRSERLNTEVAVVFDDETFAGEVEEGMDANLANAWRIGVDGKPVGHHRRYPGVKLCKRIKIRLVRLIVPFIRGQL